MNLRACEGGVAATRATIAGLVVALGLPLAYHLVLEPRLLQPSLGIGSRALIGYAIMWALAAGVIGITVAGERRPLTTIGLQRLPVRLALLAVGIGVLLSLLVPVLSFAAHALTATGEDALVEVATGVAVPLLIVGVVTAAVTEEVLFRGYALERLKEVTGRWWLAGVVSVGVFTVIHLPGWGTAHALGVVLPLATALTALYIWKRNLLLVMLVHLVIDAPLIVLALIGAPRL